MVRKKALNHGGDNDAEILEHYGEILYTIRRKSKALEYWEKAKNFWGR
jgi:hypothetical protein